ncbi:MAG: guanylate kinase [Phycisphaerae bacterium]
MTPATDTNAAGLAVVATGPSGVGKSTILSEVRKRMECEFSISATTRQPRGGETDGVDYYFLSKQEFMEKVESGDMLEWAQVYGEYYGTPAGPVRQARARGKTIVMDVDVQGAEQIHESLPDALLLLIVPPDEDELEKRLRGRKTESEDKLQQRLSRARSELARARESGIFDAEIVNDRLEQAVLDTMEIIRHRSQQTDD